MAGMVHASDVRVAEGLRDIELPAEPGPAMRAVEPHASTTRSCAGTANRATTSPTSTSSRRRGRNEPMGYCFPHFFVLPMYSSASSYRFRPLGPEETLMEIWSLTRFPEGEEPPRADAARAVGRATTRGGRRSPSRTSRTCRGSRRACTPRASSTCASPSRSRATSRTSSAPSTASSPGCPTRQLLPALRRGQREPARAARSSTSGSDVSEPTRRSPRSPRASAPPSPRTPRPSTTAAPTTSWPPSVPTASSTSPAWAPTRATTPSARPTPGGRRGGRSATSCSTRSSPTGTDDEAEAISDVVFVLQGKAGWAIQLVGRYHDTLHRDGGTWRFHRRVATFVDG